MLFPPAVRLRDLELLELFPGPNRIGAWGASAGGHLVAMLGVAPDRLELEGQGLHLQVMGEGRIDVMTDARFASRLSDALANSEANIEALEKEGLR